MTLASFYYSISSWLAWRDFGDSLIEGSRSLYELENNLEIDRND